MARTHSKATAGPASFHPSPPDSLHSNQRRRPQYLLPLVGREGLLNVLQVQGLKDSDVVHVRPHGALQFTLSRRGEEEEESFSQSDSNLINTELQRRETRTGSEHIESSNRLRSSSPPHLLQLGPVEGLECVGGLRNVLLLQRGPQWRPRWRGDASHAGAARRWRWHARGRGWGRGRRHHHASGEGRRRRGRHRGSRASEARQRRRTRGTAR